MTVADWYDPAKHRRNEKPADYKDVAPTDVEGLYKAYLYRRKERAVKVAHLFYVEDKLRRCFLYHGVHSFKQHCRFLVEEFCQTRDELFGWKENKRPLQNMPYVNDHFWNPQYDRDTKPQ